jgi:hypothetical protein
LGILTRNHICGRFLKESSPILWDFDEFHPIFLIHVRNVENSINFSRDFEEETYGKLMDEYGAQTKKTRKLKKQQS